ncbi:hypothetical protein MASR2M41_13460 [Flammeovirgaceae bacterium]
MRLLMIVLLVSLCIASTSNAQTETSRIKNYNVKKSLAIEGYDPVCYFSNNPQKGKHEFSYAYKNITYWFSSRANLDKFKTSPDNYEPAYGGWCTYAIGESGED